MTCPPDLLLSPSTTLPSNTCSRQHQQHHRRTVGGKQVVAGICWCVKLSSCFPALYCMHCWFVCLHIVLILATVLLH